MLALADPTLARSAPLPAAPGWRFEPKLDGFRCLTCTHGGRLRVRSRRGWDITNLLQMTGLDFTAEA
jgi:ATP-dependent DNA ligase